ncbi:MAG: FAD-dependent monooxygenase [Candidatus Eremiobacterota bacterium]
MKVLIAGGGIAGLFLCYELARRGIPSQVYEKCHQFGHVGGGLTLKSPALRALEAGGLAEAVRKRGLPMRCHEILDSAGERLGLIDFEPLYRQGMAEGVMIHRAAFHEALLSALPQGSLTLGAAVDRIRVGEDGVEVHVDGVGSVSADVLVGADGLHSRVRELGFDSTPHPLGFRSYRWVVPNVGADHFREFMGLGMSLGCIPLSAEELFLWLSAHARPGDPDPSRDLDGFKALMAQFTHPVVVEAQKGLTSSDQVLCTDIHEVTMEEYFNGRCVLIGDAAHAMSPSMGTGAAMAMGDALILAEELDRVNQGQADYPEAFSSFYDRRMPKVEAMRALTRAVDAEHHAHHPSVVKRRNLRIAAWLNDTLRVQEDLLHSLGGEL